MLIIVSSSFLFATFNFSIIVLLFCVPIFLQINSSLSLISNKTKIGANNNFQKKTNTSPKNAPKIAEGKEKEVL